MLRSVKDMIFVVILMFLIWFGIGFGCLYQFLKWEIISIRYYEAKLEKFDYAIVGAFSFIGPIALFILLIGYVANKDDIKRYREKNKPKLTLKQIRRNKLKKINRYRICGL